MLIAAMYHLPQFCSLLSDLVLSGIVNGMCSGSADQCDRDILSPEDHEAVKVKSECEHHSFNKYDALFTRVYSEDICGWQDV